MSTGYGWEGLRQVCAMLLGARHVPELLCGGSVSTRGAITNVLLCLYNCDKLTHGKKIISQTRIITRLNALVHAF